MQEFTGQQKRTLQRAAGKLTRPELNLVQREALAAACSALSLAGMEEGALLIWGLEQAWGTPAEDEFWNALPDGDMDA